MVLYKVTFKTMYDSDAVGKHPKRTIVNAFFYLNKSGAQWRLLPKEFPPRKTIYDHYSQWNNDQINRVVLTLLTTKTRETHYYYSIKTIHFGQT